MTNPTYIIILKALRDERIKFITRMTQETSEAGIDMVPEEDYPYFMARPKAFDIINFVTIRTLQMRGWIDVNHYNNFRINERGLALLDKEKEEEEKRKHANKL